MVSGKANSSSSGSDNPEAGEGGEAARGAAGKGRGRRERRAKTPPRPLDQAALHDLALAYVARFATTGAKLEAYLRRKLRARGGAEDGAENGAEDKGDNAAAIAIPALVARMIALGYVDDDAYARMRSRDLAARGLGARRIEQALWAAGVDEQLRSDHAPDEAARRRAAALMASKRRLGPYGTAPDSGQSTGPDHQRRREKAIAAMLRAGHDLVHARCILDAAAIEDVEAWVAEAEAESETAAAADPARGPARWRDDT